MIKLEDIKQFDLLKVFKVNPDIKIQEKFVDDLTYIVIDDYLANPEYFIEFISSFPTDNLQQKFENDLKNNIENEFIKPLGIQQLLPNSYFEIISYNFYKLLMEVNYIPQEDLKKIKNREKLSNIIKNFIYYTNILHPNLVCNKNSNMPHFDQFNYTFNIHLNKNVGGGLDFYNLNIENTKFSSIQDILNCKDQNIRKKISELLNVHCVSEKELVPYTNFTENEIFKKYHSIDYKFNRLIIHEGKYWHKINYDETKETNVRYSLVSCFTEPK